MISVMIKTMLKVVNMMVETAVEEILIPVLNVFVMKKTRKKLLNQSVVSELNF